MEGFVIIPLCHFPLCQAHFFGVTTVVVRGILYGKMLCSCSCFSKCYFAVNSRSIARISCFTVSPQTCPAHMRCLKSNKREINCRIFYAIDAAAGNVLRNCRSNKLQRTSRNREMERALLNLDHGFRREANEYDTKNDSFDQALEFHMQWSQAAQR